MAAMTNSSFRNPPPHRNITRSPHDWSSATRQKKAKPNEGKFERDDTGNHILLDDYRHAAIQSERYARSLRKEILELKNQMAKIEPQKSGMGAAAMIEITYQILRVIKRHAVDENNFMCLGVIPEVLTILNTIPFQVEELRRIGLQLRQLLKENAKLTDSGHVHALMWSKNLIGDEFPSAAQTNVINELEELDAPQDLKYLAVATRDRTWCELKSWWMSSPLSLRWMSISTGRKQWLAYHPVYSRSPEDLRYIAILYDDPKWLTLCTIWRWVPIDIKLRAVATRDITQIKPTEFFNAPFRIGQCSCGAEQYRHGEGCCCPNELTEDAQYLIPKQLRGQGPRVTVANRCICCPIHCTMDGCHGERLDLNQLTNLTAKIDEKLNLDYHERQATITKWKKEVEKAKEDFCKKVEEISCELNEKSAECREVRKEFEMKSIELTKTKIRLAEAEGERDSFKKQYQDLKTKVTELASMKKEWQEFFSTQKQEIGSAIENAVRICRPQIEHTTATPPTDMTKMTATTLSPRSGTKRPTLLKAPTVVSPTTPETSQSPATPPPPPPLPPAATATTVQSPPSSKSVPQPFKSPPLVDSKKNAKQAPSDESFLNRIHEVSKELLSMPSVDLMTTAVVHAPPGKKKTIPSPLPTPVVKPLPKKAKIVKTSA